MTAEAVAAREIFVRLDRGDGFADPQTQAWYGHCAGQTLLDYVLPYIASANAASQMPTELLGDALLSIVRDWLMIPERQKVMLGLRTLEANRRIVERGKEEAAATRTAARPTRRVGTQARRRRGR